MGTLSVTLQESVEYAEALEDENRRLKEQLARQDEIITLADELAIKVACYRNSYPDEDTRRGDLRGPLPEALAKKRPKTKPYSNEEVAEWYRMRQGGMTIYEISKTVHAGFDTVKTRLAKHTPPEPEPKTAEGHTTADIAQETGLDADVIEASLQSSGHLCRYCGEPVSEDGRGGVCAKCIRERTTQRDGVWACEVGSMA